MTMPNFLVIGAAKAGTTSLYRYLREHPEIYMSPHKEPRFFALEGQQLDFRGPGDMTKFNFVTDLESYQALFENVSCEKAIGEVSPWYLYVPQSARRIKHHIPDAKLIAILRDPAERAFSNYLHAIREHLEPIKDFQKALDLESDRIAKNWSYRWHYREKGYYSGQLKRYLETFDNNQIRIYLFEDLKEDPQRVLRDIYKFLGVDCNFIADTSQQYNVAQIPRSGMLDEALSQPNRITPILGKIIPSRQWRKSIKSAIRNLNMGPKPAMSRETRAQLIADYREDIIELQSLINRDLSSWLSD